MNGKLSFAAPVGDGGCRTGAAAAKVKVEPFDDGTGGQPLAKHRIQKLARFERQAGRTSFSESRQRRRRQLQQHRLGPKRSSAGAAIDRREARSDADQKCTATAGPFTAMRCARNSAIRAACPRCTPSKLPTVTAPYEPQPCGHHVASEPRRPAARRIMLMLHGRPDGRDRASGSGRGKSGLRRARWWVTPTVRKDRESATEKIPPGQ